MDRNLDEYNSGPKQTSKWMTDYANEGGRAFMFIRQSRYKPLTAEAKGYWYVTFEERVGSKTMMLLCNDYAWGRLLGP